MINGIWTTVYKFKYTKNRNTETQKRALERIWCEPFEWNDPEWPLNVTCTKQDYQHQLNGAIGEIWTVHEMWSVAARKNVTHFHVQSLTATQLETIKPTNNSIRHDRNRERNMRKRDRAMYLSIFQYVRFTAHWTNRGNRFKVDAQQHTQYLPTVWNVLSISYSVDSVDMNEREYQSEIFKLKKWGECLDDSVRDAKWLYLYQGASRELSNRPIDSSEEKPMKRWMNWFGESKTSASIRYGRYDACGNRAIRVRLFSVCSGGCYMLRVS